MAVEKGNFADKLKGGIAAMQYTVKEAAGKAKVAESQIHSYMNEGVVPYTEDTIRRIAKALQMNGDGLYALALAERALSNKGAAPAKPQKRRCTRRTKGQLPQVTSKSAFEDLLAKAVRDRRKAKTVCAIVLSGDAAEEVRRLSKRYKMKPEVIVSTMLLAKK